MVDAPESARTVTPATSSSRLPTWLLAVMGVLVAVAAYSVYRTSEVTGQLTAIERERVSLMQEKSRLDTALVAARKQVDELKSVHASAEAEIKKSREDAKAASTQSVQFQERAKALETELGAVRGQLQSREAEFEKARQDASSVAKARSEIEARAVGIEKDMSARVNDLQQRLDDAQKRLQAALEAKERAERQMQQAPQAAPAPQQPNGTPPPATPMRL